MDLNLDFSLWRTCRKLERYWLPEFKQGIIDFNDDSSQLIFALEAIENPEVLNILVDILHAQGDGASPSVVRVVGRLASAKELDTLVNIASNGEHPLVESAMQGLLDAARERGVIPENGTSKTLRKGLSSANPKVVAASCRLAGLWEDSALTDQIQALLASIDSSKDIRRAAGEALTHLDSRKVRKFLGSFLRSNGHIEARLIAAATLTELNVNAGADAVAHLLTEDLSRGQIEDLVRPTIIKQGAIEPLTEALVDKKVSQFVATEFMQLLEVSGRDSSTLSEALRNASDMSTFNHDDPRGGRTAEFVSRLAEGDALLGEAIYNRAQLACIDCHAIAGKGGTLGPDLGSIGSSAPMDYIIQSIIEPSEKIKEGYRAVEIETKDNDFYFGSVLREDEYSIFLRASANKEIQVVKSTINTLETSTLSMMPSELTTALTDAEFLDLLAFLGGLGKH
jgi:putative heme-binding domain-containing protein